MADLIPLLAAHTWETSYRHEDGNLIELFYVPALSCAVQYDRMTGYFSASALSLAARGIERLIANGGRMRLIVGCTLDDDEIRAIEQGYDLREQVERKLAAVPLTAPDLQARQGLEALAWMVAHGCLDVKVAVPTNSDGKPVSIMGIYHEKVGLITDREGNRLGFSGSINETAGGWVNNRESFHVHLSWEAGRDYQHVGDDVEAFHRLWEGRATSVKVLDFPDAVKALLLQFLSSDDRFVAPPRPPVEPPKPDDVIEPVPYLLLPEEKRHAVWTYIRHAARMTNGSSVGEATAAVTAWPHQVRAYHRMLDAWPCQLLIADEVGLGKTVTAGLFIRQVWLSGQAKRILLMVPSALLTQWQDELYEKFNLNIPIYNGHRLIWKKTHGWQGALERKVESQEWQREPFVLCSSHLMRRRDRSQELLDADDWDLLVLDEAHHARRKSPGTAQEGGPNNLLRLMEQLRSKCKSLVLLTATPMQVHPVELWDLLGLLGLPGKWEGNRHLFLRYFEEASGNPSQSAMEFLADMFRETEAAFGEISENQANELVPSVNALGCRKLLRALRDHSGIPLKRLDVLQRKGALEILRRFSPTRYRMSRHTRSLLREYHRQGLLSSPIATRDVRDIPLEMSPSERALYDAVEDYISQTYDNAAPEKRSSVGFVMTIYRRRLASSFYALQQTLNKRLANVGGISDEDISDDEQVEDVMDADEANATAALVSEEKDSILNLLKQIARAGANTKARVLKEQLEQAFADGYDSAIVFTQYTDTMEFLKEHIAADFPGMTVGCYSRDGGQLRDSAGFWTRCSKEQIKQRLKAGAIRLLICTDAAAEGLNLQSCGVLVNYDLPWNPMKVEQRIGRIDRIGQRYAAIGEGKIRVINLAYRDTVEADVYFALGARIQLFEGLVGRLQPILSMLPKRFAEVALQRPENRAAARDRLLADLDQAARDADKSSLDIDDVAAEILEIPSWPSPALTLADLDLALNRSGILPPGIALRPLDAGSYGLKIPGFDRELRVTTSADVFDDHFESHDFISPGGRVFELLASQVAGAEGASKDVLHGRVWMVEASGTGTCGFFARRGACLISVASLAMLLEILEEPSDPGSLELPENLQGTDVHCLA